MGVPDMPIGDLAREDVVRADSTTPVSVLATRMREASAGSVIITDGNRPVGIVTDRDLSMRVVGAEQDPSEEVAEDVMSSDVCTIRADAGVFEAAELMAANAVRRRPVCGENDELQGIITADDLVELLSDEHQQVAAVIRAQRPEY